MDHQPVAILSLRPGKELHVVRWRGSEWVAGPELAAAAFGWSPLTLQREWSCTGRLSGYLGKTACTDRGVLLALVRAGIPNFGSGPGFLGAVRHVTLVRVDALPDVARRVGQPASVPQHYIDTFLVSKRFLTKGGQGQGRRCAWWAVAL